VRGISEGSVFMVFKRKFLNVFLVISCLSFFGHVVLRSDEMKNSIGELKQKLTELTTKLKIDKKIKKNDGKSSVAIFKNYEEFIKNEEYGGISKLNIDLKSNKINTDNIENEIGNWDKRVYEILQKINISYKLVDDIEIQTPFFSMSFKNNFFAIKSGFNQEVLKYSDIPILSDSVVEKVVTFLNGKDKKSEIKEIILDIRDICVKLIYNDSFIRALSKKGLNNLLGCLNNFKSIENLSIKLDDRKDSYVTDELKIFFEKFNAKSLKKFVFTFGLSNKNKDIDTFIQNICYFLTKNKLLEDLNIEFLDRHKHFRSPSNRQFHLKIDHLEMIANALSSLNLIKSLSLSVPNGAVVLPFSVEQKKASLNSVIINFVTSKYENKKSGNLAGAMQNFRKKPIQKALMNIAEELYLKGIENEQFVEIKKQLTKGYYGSSDGDFNTVDHDLGIAVNKLKEYLLENNLWKDEYRNISKEENDSLKQFKFFCEQIVNIKNLKNLHISLLGNTITDLGVEILCQNFQKIKSLENFSINLDNSQISDSGVKNLTNLLKEFSLKKLALSLGNNSITYISSGYLEDLFLKMNGLKELDLFLLFNNDPFLSDNWLKTLGNGLKTLNELISFNFGITTQKLNGFGLFCGNINREQETVEDLIELENIVLSMKNLTKLVLYSNVDWRNYNGFNKNFLDLSKNENLRQKNFWIDLMKECQKLLEFDSQFHINSPVYKIMQETFESKRDALYLQWAIRKNYGKYFRKEIPWEVIEIVRPKTSPAQIE
jgi:hypothetical protein